MVLPVFPSFGWGHSSHLFCWMVLLGFLLLWAVLLYPSPFACYCFPFPPLGGAIFSSLLLLYSSPFAWRCFPFPPLGSGAFPISFQVVLPSFPSSRRRYFFSPPLLLGGARPQPQRHTGRSTRPKKRRSNPRPRRKAKPETQGQPPRPRRKGHHEQLTPTLWGGAAFLLSSFLVRDAVLDIFTKENVTAKISDFPKIKEKRRMFISKVKGKKKTLAEWKKMKNEKK